MDDTLFQIVAVSYVVLFLLFAARLPRVALALCFGLGPILRSPASLPVHFTITDLNLVLTFSVYCLKQFAYRRPLRWGPLGVYCLLYLIVCFLASIGDWRGSDTAVAYLQMIPYLVCAVILFANYGDSLEDLRPAFHLLMLVGLFLSVSVIAVFTPFIYGMHKNAVASSLACVVVLEVELWLAENDQARRRVYLFCLTTSVAALVISLSRGAWLGTIAGIATILFLRRDSKTMLRLGAAIIPLIIVVWIMVPEDSKATATGFEPSRNNIADRIKFGEYAWKTFTEQPLLGAGVGLRKEVDAVNVVLMALAESGVLGLLTFSLIFVALIKMASRASKSLTPNSWTFSCLAIGTALMMVKLVHSMVDHYWSRGCITVAWAGAGFATRAFFVSQTVPREEHLAQPLPAPAPRRRPRIPSNHRTPWPRPGTQLPPPPLT